MIRDLKSRTLEAEELLRQFGTCVSKFVAAEMMVIGYHNPKSRGWRKVKKMENSTSTLDRSEACGGEPQKGPAESGHLSEVSSSPTIQSASAADFEPAGQLNRAMVRRGGTSERARNVESQGVRGFGTPHVATPGAAGEKTKLPKILSRHWRLRRMSRK